tara:strand:- start:768 stop:959 length:192 start_codon:yes stop_codon:yes gene_type:complete
MEKLIEAVLNKYSRKVKSNGDLAKLITAHMRVGINGNKGWYLNLNNHNGQFKQSEEIIEEFGG